MRQSPSAGRSPSSNWRIPDIMPAEYIPLFAAFLILAFVYRSLNPVLFSISGIRSVTTQFLPLILAAMAQSLIMIVGGIDLSIGAQISLTTCVLATLMTGGLSQIVVAMLVVASISICIGLITGSLVGYLRLPAIIVTLGTSFAITGIALLIMPVPGGAIPSWLMAWYTSDIFGLVPVPLAILIAAIVAWKLLKTSPLGLSIYATGDNETGAFVSGIVTTRVRLIAYSLAGILTMMSGISIAVQIGSGDPTIGTPYTLNSIAAAVLGGTSFAGGEGRMRGTLLGALVLGFLFNVLFFSGISPFYQYIVQGLALVGAVGLKSLTAIHVRRRHRA